MLEYCAAIEDKVGAIAAVRSEISKGRLFPAEINPLSKSSFRRYELSALRTAEIYAWSKEITDAVISSSLSLPSDTALSLTQYQDYQSGWFWFDHVVNPEAGIENGVEPFRAILWTVLPPGDGQLRSLIATTYGPRGSFVFEATNTAYLSSICLNGVSQPEPCSQDVLDAVSSDSQGFDNVRALNREAPVIRFIVASMLWIEQDIIQLSTHPLPRHVMKRLGADVGATTDIKIVRLRRMARAHDHQTDGLPVEWSCRWIVRGHWRQQFYPSSGERKPIWVLPHVKGPDDKPLKAPSQTVFVVNR